MQIGVLELRRHYVLGLFVAYIVETAV